jgi:hypothetical protein
VVAVDHADAIVAIDPPAAVPATQSTYVCFDAESGSASVAGATWSFLVDGVATAGYPSSTCVLATPSQTSGSMVVQATAAGASATLTLPIGAATRRLPPAARPDASDPAGERAARSH